MQVLEKSQTQEEFIRGRMTKNPYSMKAIGQTMRDVKNKICVDLELFGLLEDDFSMELLVADKIVKLDLDIDLVYEQVCEESTVYAAQMINPSIMGVIT